MNWSANQGRRQAFTTYTLNRAPGSRGAREGPGSTEGAEGPGGSKGPGCMEVGKIKLEESKKREKSWFKPP
jgi:hypothetical protein